HRLPDSGRGGGCLLFLRSGSTLLRPRGESCRRRDSGTARSNRDLITLHVGRCVQRPYPSQSEGEDIRAMNQTKRVTCPYCAVGCHMQVTTLDGKVTEVAGDASSPVNHGLLCPKGALAGSILE